MSSGSLFLESAELKVQASGASAAGFEPFEASFKATKFIQTSPTLADIGIGTVLGTGNIPVSWVAGSDKSTITATASGTGGKIGSIVCEANADGTYQVPREAIKAAVSGADLSGVLLSISRSRTEVKKDLKTKGTLTGTKVESVGWVDLVTTTKETASFICSPGEAVCSDKCIDVKSDPENCGKCGKKCDATDDCDNGTCVGDTSGNRCFDESVKTGQCKDQSAACQADTECKALLMCLDACSTQGCVSTCFQTHQAGVQKQQAIRECGCFSACSLECARTC